MTDYSQLVNEVWATVVGFSNYEVSNMGRVRSKPRRRTKGGVLSPGRRSGYLSVFLYPTDGPRTGAKNMTVHRLVADAFLGACPSGHEIRHLNGNADDSRLSNLSYGTRKDNAADREVHGKTFRGERTPSAKLNWQQVQEIRRLQGQIGQSELAAKFGINRTTVQRIQAFQTWSSQS